MKPGYIIIISGPSGVGKGTIIKRVLNVRDDLILSVSATTRKPRPGEVDGISYHFMSTEEFKEAANAGAFLEYCEVHGNLYGTLLENVNNTLNQGKHILLEIDTQGAEKVRLNHTRVISIFVVPPTFQTLINRLHERNTEDPDVIKNRLMMAGNELATIGKYDYIVVNDKLDVATTDILDILDSLETTIN
ncbi:MAG: guanylate kinase [bacterium]|nr:guanylate kinase [bacterium]